MGTDHRIGRLTFELEAPGRARLAAFGDRLRAGLDAELLPALAVALDRIDRPGALIRLGRIELDLGSLDPAAALGPRLAAALAAFLPAAAAAPDPVEELAAFLETGALPWPEPGAALAAIAAVLARLSSAAFSAAAARLAPPLRREAPALRFARQLPAGVVRRLILALASVALRPMPPTRTPHRSLDATATPGGPPADVPLPEPAATAAAVLILRLTRGEGPHPLPSALATLLPELVAAPPAPPPRRTPLPAPPAGEAADLRAPSSPPIAPAPPAAPGQRDTPAAEIAVHAAGAVLLYPFLPAYFDQLGLLAAPGRFRDDPAQGDAVLLGHFLATGETEPPEPDCLLMKLLCGMPLARPLSRRAAGTPAARAEADGLLAAVIRHWARLGATSSAGLREGFLMRPGLLAPDGAHPRLRVERRGVDVLLDHLPWPLSRVQTPFMPTALAVDWRSE